MLRDTRLVLAGVTTAGGAGHAVARRALLDGAHVTLVAPPSELARCRRLADALPRGAHVVCADLAREEDVAALHEHLRCAYRTVDGALHAALPHPALGAPGLAALAALGRAVAPLLPPGGGSLVGLAPRGGAARPPALEAAVRRLARELASAGGRVNVLAFGRERPTEVARASCLLLGSRAPDVTGRVLRPDRWTSDRRGAGSPAHAPGWRIPGGPPPVHTSLTPFQPAAPAATDQRGASL